MTNSIHGARRRLTAVWAVALASGLFWAGSAWSDDNWANYRGPSEQGLVEAGNLPLKWSESEHVAWKVPVEGKAWSSPVIWGDRIWLTNAPEDGSSYSVVCLDKQTGKTVYSKNLLRVALPQYCHPFNSYASPSPVVEEGRVYLSFGSPYNACLEAGTGNVIWQRTDFVCNHFRGAGSSPFLYQQMLILHFDGSDQQYVVAMDKATGQTIWQTSRTIDFQDQDPATGKPTREGDYRKAFSTPRIIDVAGRPVLISLGSMALYGYDPDTGKELWRVDRTGSHSGACRPVIGHGLIFCPMGADGELIAVKPDGSGNVTDSHVVWSYKRAVPRRPSLLLAGDLLFMVTDQGVAACLDARTGQEHWRERLGGNFSASPILANGRIYFLDEDGKATIVAASNQFQVLAENKLDGGFMASPAASGNALFLRTKTHLYRIEGGS